MHPQCHALRERVIRGKLSDVGRTKFTHEPLSMTIDHEAERTPPQVSSIEGCFDRWSFRSTKVDSINDKYQFDRRL